MHVSQLVQNFIPKPQSNEYILNVGAGHNDDNHWLADQGYAIHAVDPTYSEEAKEGLIQKFPVGIQDFVLLPEKYKAIVAMNSLQFVGPDLPKVALKLMRALKPDGVLVCRVPLKLRSAVQNRDAKLTVENLLNLFADLEQLYLKEYWTDEKPHPGADFPHRHYVVDFVAKKK
ncbi:MAG: methyltransferase domain-containing protein [Candidatus Andersenbacteria bacterium]